MQESYHKYNTLRADVVRAALTYAGEGIPVFPCKPGGKEPLTQHGFKDASTDASKITAWFNRWPNANIGIPTGERSGILALDVDNPASLETLEAEHGELPATTTIRTGSGGLHYYFRYPAGEKISISAGKLGPGLDTRGEGGYVIAPPSVATGPYEVLDRLPLAAPPGWLLQALRKPQSAADRTANGPISTGSPVSANVPIAEGQRNQSLFRYGCALRNRGADDASILEELLDTNERLCRPPLDDGEVERIATSASKYEPGSASPGPGAETLEALDEIEAENLWGRKWKGSPWKTPRSLMVALITEARRHGQKTKAGVKVSISVRQLALSASVSKQALTRSNGALDKLRDAGLIKSVKRSGTKSGAYVLLAPTRAKWTHSTTGYASSSSGSTLRAPRLRHNKPVYETVDRVAARVATVLRLGKNAEEIIDILENAGETMSVADLATAKGITRLRDLRNRVLPRLEAAGVVECSGDAVKLRPDWLAALNRKREEDQELADYERDKKKYAEESRVFALKLEARKLSHLGMSLEDIACDLKIGMEDVYRLLNIKRPVADFAESSRDDEVEEFDFEDDLVEDFEEMPEPDVALLTPLAVAVRDYLDRNPYRDGETPSYIASHPANTLWARGLYPAKPTRLEPAAGSGGLTGERHRLAGA